MYPESATPTPRFAESAWRKSSLCTEGSECVEVARGDQLVGMRDSKNPQPVLLIATEAWRAFIADLKAGRFR